MNQQNQAPQKRIRGEPNAGKACETQRTPTAVEFGDRSSGRGNIKKIPGRTFLMSDPILPSLRRHRAQELEAAIWEQVDSHADAED